MFVEGMKYRYEERVNVEMSLDLPSEGCCCLAVVIIGGFVNVLVGGELPEDPCFFVNGTQELEGWQDSLEGCHEKKSTHLALCSPARSTGGGSRIGPQLRFSRDLAAGLVSKSAEHWLGVWSC